jgi:predicted nuclease of predicted toxin-antitoxin system
MRLLANENFPADAVEALRSRGHDVAWVRTDAPGSTDRQVLDRAVADGRLRITFDKDFGELAFRAGRPALFGVVLFRIRLASPAQVAQRAVAVLESRADWAGHFAVVLDDRVRMTLLPSNGHSNP